MLFRSNVWSPPSVTILGCSLPSLAIFFIPPFFSAHSLATGLARRVEYAVSIWSIASALSYGEMGMSPQSTFCARAGQRRTGDGRRGRTMVAPDCQGLNPHGIWYPREGACRRDPDRIPYGPNLAPFLSFGSAPLQSPQANAGAHQDDS